LPALLAGPPLFMFNSFTNFLHALALFIYAGLTYRGLEAGRPHYTWSIFWCFALIFFLKVIGILVHLPAIEHHKARHDFFWVWIAVGLQALNTVTLMALDLNYTVVATGSIVSLVFVVIFLRSLRGPGYFGYLALATVIVYLLAAVFTRSDLRLAWICVVISSALWIVLARVPFLLKYKFHNDIYHFALIASTYYLYTTVGSGLWEGNRLVWLW